MEAGQHVLPVTRIRPPSPWAALDVGHLWEFRELGYRLFRRDLTVRYRQTLLGVLWVVLQPLLTAGAFTLIFDRVADVPSPAGVPYFVLAFWGSTAFTAFNQGLVRAADSLVGNAALVSKVYFPRLLLPLSSSVAVALDAAVASALGLALVLSSGVPLTWRVATLPVWLAAVLLLGLALGVVFAPLVLRYRDVAYVLPLLAQLLLYLSPVGYTLAAVPDSLSAAYLVNPLAPLLEAVRWAALGTAAPPGPWLALACAVVLGTLVVGAYVFRSQERVFADVV